MSSYDPEYHRKYYQKNRDRLLIKRREYNKKRSESEEGKEKDRVRNQSPKRKAYRKAYKQTDAGKKSNLKYNRKTEVKLRHENTRLKSRYGITTEEKNDMYKEQNGKCAICGKECIILHVDHCHKTNVVRGLLCGCCNRGLGMFKDNPNLLNKAINYLKNGKLHKNNSSN